MSEASKQWVGQIVDGIYPLLEWLGGSDHSAVFLTEYKAAAAPKAAIKLVAADETADLRLASWELATNLTHRNLLRVFATGRCFLAGNDLLYSVIELADENLSEVVPQRALRPDETRQMLCPVLDALEYLHGKGFVHGDLKPANILASGDDLKISTDTIVRAGEAQAPWKKSGPYDAPEAISGALTPAADVWALGNTLVEVMTQHLPDWQPGPNREPVVPVDMPAPFQEIARLCLRLEPQRRASIADIAARMNPRVAVASAAAATVSAIPAATAAREPVPSASVLPPASFGVPPKSAGAMPVPSKIPPRMGTDPNRRFPYKDPGAKSRFIVPLAIGALIFAAILTAPRLLTNQTATRHTAKVTPTNTAPTAKADAENAQPTATASSKLAAAPEHNSTVAATKQPSDFAKDQRTAQAKQPTNPDGLKTASDKVAPPVGAPSNASTDAVESGAVLDQVLPDVSAKARATIRGRVRVGVKLEVDAAGAVSGAELDSPGPSKFFADLALNAGKKWVFTPPEVNGKSVSSEWVLRFVFTQGDTKVTPSRIKP